MRRVLLVAVREFVSTVTTKGFVIGVLGVPALMVGLIALLPALIDDVGPAVRGTIAVQDLTEWEGEGGVTLIDLIERAYAPEVLAAERSAMAEAGRAQVREALGEAAEAQAARAIEQQLGSVPEVQIERVASGATLEPLKARLSEGSVQDGGLLAVVQIHPSAVAVEAPPGAAAAGSPYEVFLRERLDDRFQNPLHAKVREAITQARFDRAGLDPVKVRQVMGLSRGEQRVITSAGLEKEAAHAEVGMLIAIGFMMLLWISTMTGGQYLMTTVIEEKSSRVMEVLLSAASPMQLMTGKILGQLAVALCVLGVYLTIGLVALKRFDYLYLLDTSSIALLVAFFLIAFLLLGSLMAAIGSAVTEVREAQALLTPVMLIFIIPLMLWAPIARNPNGTFATVLSFIPPVNPFVMVIRMAGNEPVPAWQIGLSLLVGVLSVLVAVWLAAKIFRIGVLMYGKPPNLKTLVRWVRMA